MNIVLLLLSKLIRVNYFDLCVFILFLISLRMTKDRSCMYGSIESSEFVNEVLEFYSISVKHQVRTCELVFFAHMSSVAMYQR